jgi:hypothetical protein
VQFLTSRVEEIIGRLHVLAATSPGRQSVVPMEYEADWILELVWRL